MKKERNKKGRYIKGHTGLSGAKNGNWKGKAISIVGVHSWIRAKKGRADHCEMCSSVSAPNKKKKWFHWANISGEYKRVLEDWVQLCIKCHRKYDNHIFLTVDHRGSKNPFSKLTEADVIKIIKMRNRNIVLSTISKKFNISISMCSRIINRKFWTHVKC